jgi:alpha-tubulin suppressor-like RCC1 family protein
VGTAYSWGEGSSGQLAGGLTSSSSSAMLVDTLTVGVADACAGFAHSAFVDVSGGFWTVGDNEKGQLGDGTNTARLTVRFFSSRPF